MLSLGDDFLARSFEPVVACCLLLLVACCCLLLLLLPKSVAHPWTLKNGIKPRQSKPRLVLKTGTKTELCQSTA